jgi:hypothetical protein
MSAAEIHCEICTVYSQNVMSEGTVRQWCSSKKGKQMLMMKGEVVGRPSAVSDNLVQSADQKNL